MTLLMIISKPTLLISTTPFLFSHSLAKAQLITTDPSSHTSQDPILTGVTIALFTAAFVLLYLVFYYFLNHFFRGPARLAPAQIMSESPGWTRGLDPVVLRTFPVFTYSEVVVHRLDDEKRPLECAVCLSMFEEDETLRLLPKCDHVFHVECVDTWLATHSTCPYCRAELEPMPGESTRVPESRVEELEDVNEAGNDVVEATQARREGEGSQKGGQLRRWKSTGHMAGGDRVGVEDEERFTLRLPVEVRHDIVTGRLNRSRSCIIVMGVDVI